MSAAPPDFDAFNRSLMIAIPVFNRMGHCQRLLESLHASRDLAGPGADSWQSRLTAAGFTTVIQPAGLGEQPAFCQVLVEHIAEAAAAAGLELA